MARFEIHGDNLTVTDAIHNYIKEKVGKLERYFNNVPNVVTHVRVKTYSNFTTKIGVIIPLEDVTLKTEERHDDLYTGINLITNRLEKQVCRYKTRVNHKHRDRGDQDISAAEVQESTTDNRADDIESENDTEIIRSKQFSLKPMDSEETVLQANLLGHDFFIPTGGETDGTSIVYRRKDGRYGLIETTEQVDLYIIGYGITEAELRVFIGLLNRVIVTNRVRVTNTYMYS